MRSLGSGSLSYEPVEEFRGNQRSGQPLPFLDRQAGRKLDPPLGPLDLRGEDVAAAAHRLDHRRLFQVVFELTPKPADLDIDRAIEWPGLAITGDTEQLVPGQHLIWVVDERRKQIEFASCEPDLFARRRKQLSAGKIEGPAGEPCLRSR